MGPTGVDCLNGGNEIGAPSSTQGPMMDVAERGREGGERKKRKAPDNRSVIKNNKNTTD